MSTAVSTCPPRRRPGRRKSAQCSRTGKPGPEELLASGQWKGPILVEGAREFWNAIRAVRALREAQGLTLQDVSKRCGIDVATLSKLENGKQPNPTLFTILLYVGAVGQRLSFTVGARPRAAAQVSEVRDPDP